MAQYEIVQYTLNPNADRPSVYIGLYLLKEGGRSKSLLTQAQVIRNGQTQSRPTGNQTRFDIASGQAQEVHLEQLAVFETSSPEIANKAKIETINGIDTARFELLNSSMSGARTDKALREQCAQSLWDFHRANPGYIRNTGSALKSAVIDLVVEEGYTLEAAIVEVDASLD